MKPRCTSFLNNLVDVSKLVLTADPVYHQGDQASLYCKPISLEISDGVTIESLMCK